MKRLLLLTALTLPVLAFAQGALTPSDAPAPTMKSLDQIEPRTPVGQVGGSFDLIAISEPGSYVLLGNVSVTAGDAIAITASNVTLDLNGFMLSSSEKTPSGAAISIGGGIDNVTVRNGHIRSSSRLDMDLATPQFVTGAGFKSGIVADIATRSISVENLEVSGVKAGIAVSRAKLSIVRNCTITNCNSGIAADWVTDCNVDYCWGTAIKSYTASNCRAVTYDSSIGYNTIDTQVATNCYARSTGGMGLYAGVSATNCFGGSNKSKGVSAGSALTCTGTSQLDSGLDAHTAENCTGISTSGDGLHANMASNCIGNSYSGTGLFADNATSCRGSSASGTGLFADNATNCRGSSASGTGLDTNREENSYTGTATGCTGISENGHGLIAAIATNCTGRTTNKSMVSIWVSGTATGCRGTNTGATGTGSQTAIACDIAVACTRTNTDGVITASSKQLGTP